MVSRAMARVSMELAMVSRAMARLSMELYYALANLPTYQLTN